MYFCKLCKDLYKSGIEHQKICQEYLMKKKEIIFRQVNIEQYENDRLLSKLPIDMDRFNIQVNEMKRLKGLLEKDLSESYYEINKNVVTQYTAIDSIRDTFEEILENKMIGPELFLRTSIVDCEKLVRKLRVFQTLLEKLKG
jgi:hypothetical protein